MTTQLKKGVLDLCVLNILKNRDHYGYELVQKISKTIEITEGTIYPLLKRLKDNKLLTTYLKESTEGPSRKYYKLTELGKEEFENKLYEWVKFTKTIEEFLK